MRLVPFLCLALMAGFMPIPRVTAQHKAWIRYTDQDGLPGNTVYEVMQDSRGYLWFATEKGMCRFNGYEFYQPEDTSTYRGSEAFVPTEDGTGKIWFGRLDGTLWYIEDDTIRAWPFNEIPLRYRGRFTALDKLGVEADGTIWMGLLRLGLLRVTPDGSSKFASLPDGNRLIFHLVNGRTVYTSQLQENGPTKASPRLQVHKAGPISGNDILLATIDLEKETDSQVPAIWLIGPEEFLLYQGRAFYHISNGTVSPRYPTDIPAENVARIADGGLLVASHEKTNPGLFHFANLDALRKGYYTRHLSDQYVTFILCDQDGGWWATTANNGVFYCKDPSLDIYNQQAGLRSGEVMSLATDGAETVYAGLRPGAVHAIDAFGKVRILPDPGNFGREIRDLEYDREHRRLWTSDPLQYFNEPAFWHQPESQTAVCGFSQDFFSSNTTLAPGGDKVYCNAAFGFIELGIRDRSCAKLGVDTVQQGRLRTFSVTPGPQGELWVTTADGLRIWRNGKYETSPIEHAALRFHPRDVAFLADGTVVIALTRGILIRDPNGRSFHLTEKDGLTDDRIGRLVIGPRDEVFACTDRGLNLIRRKKDGWNIQSLTKVNGLPSNQVNDVTMLHDQLWIATSIGLVRMTVPKEPYRMRAPVIESARVNNTRRDPLSLPALRYAKDNLLIRYAALFFRAGGDIQYRYRLHDDDTSYVLTRAREISLSHLPPGAYQLGVQARDQDGSWSDPAILAFRIRPAWWQSGWFRISLVMAAFLAVTLGFLLHIRSLRHREAIRQKMREMEAAALRAQMNPHFIFNCLVSIQQFITENDKSSATTYLAKFARLIRLALHGSVDGLHTLSEEIEMLESYLALEQLRFRDRFLYAINISPDIQAEDIALPPLLIQPLVENAIQHGMKNHTEDGRIEIAMTLDASMLRVCVTDNGPGLPGSDAPAVEREGQHKSVGMMLTKGRLSLLGEGNHPATMTQVNLVDDQGHITGTRAELLLPLDLG